ncbi:MAG: DUF2914 domain-containing protein [Hyphomicrobiales bacterium]|nr:DUF2914 domain-containing protein [Hyphomicrobiales bacterium]
MYKDYYGLLEDPFSLTPDERFYYKSNTQRKSLDDLEFGLSKGEGFVVVTGDAGVGKSTLIQYLQSRLATAPVVTGWITMTRVDGEDLLRLVARAFQIAVDDPPPSRIKLLSQIETFFSRHASCLIVDEAQGLSDSGLEELRMLSNLRTGTDALLQIVLLGQPQLRDRLVVKQFEPLRQRIMAYSFLPPFDANDTRDYIAHRLSIAGWRGDPSLSSDALYRIHVESGGIPRKINLLCDRLFRHGCSREKHRLDKFDVFEVISDLGDDFFSAGSSPGKADEADRTEIYPLLEPLDGTDEHTTHMRTRSDSEAYAFAGAGLTPTDGHLAAAGLHEGPIQPLRRSAAVPGPDQRPSRDQGRDRSGPDDETRPMSATAASVFSPKLTPRPEAGLSARHAGANGSHEDDARLTATTSLRSASPHPSSYDRHPGSRRGRRLMIGVVAAVVVLAGLSLGLKVFLGEPQREQAAMSPPGSGQDKASAAPGGLRELDTKALSSMNPLMTRPDRTPTGTISQPAARMDDSAEEPPRTVPAQEEPTPAQSSNAEAGLNTLKDDTTLAPAAETGSANTAQAPDEPSTLKTDEMKENAVDESPAASPVHNTGPAETAEPQTADLEETRTPEPVVRQESPGTPPAMQPVTKPAAKPAVTPELSSAFARAQLTTEVRNREPIDNLQSPIALGALKGGRLSYFTEVIGMSGRTIHHTWIYKGQTVLDLRFTIGSDRWRVYTSKTIGQNTGPWQVVVTDESGRALIREQFVIE